MTSKTEECGQRLSRRDIGLPALLCNTLIDLRSWGGRKLQFFNKPMQISHMWHRTKVPTTRWVPDPKMKWNTMKYTKFDFLLLKKLLKQCIAHTAVELIWSVPTVRCSVTLATVINAGSITACKLVILTALAVCMYTHCNVTQESLANAKISARQPCYTGRNSLNCPSLRNAKLYQRHLYIVEKYFQCATIPPLTMRVYLHSVSGCCLPKMWSSAKFQANSDLQQFKVIHGRWFWYQSKAHMWLPISR